MAADAGGRSGAAAHVWQMFVDRRHAAVPALGWLQAGEQKHDHFGADNLWVRSGKLHSAMKAEVTVAAEAPLRNHNHGLIGHR